MPFFIAIIEAKPPMKFKILVLKSYRGRIDSYDHIVYFKSTVSLLIIDDALKCMLFFTTFKESTLRWFTRLPAGVITSFFESKRMFLTQFASA